MKTLQSFTCAIPNRFFFFSSETQKEIFLKNCYIADFCANILIIHINESYFQRNIANMTTPGGNK